MPSLLGTTPYKIRKTKKQPTPVKSFVPYHDGSWPVGVDTKERKRNHLHRIGAIDVRYKGHERDEKPKGFYYVSPQ